MYESFHQIWDSVGNVRYTEARNPRKIAAYSIVFIFFWDRYLLIVILPNIGFTFPHV